MDKTQFEIDGASHIETYRIPAYLDAALNQVAPFFSRTLRTRS